MTRVRVWAATSRSGSARRLSRASPGGVAVKSRLFDGLVGRLEELDRLAGHDGRDRVLVDELRMTVASQKHAEIVEPGHDALQLDAVDQENGERNLVLPNMI